MIGPVKATSRMVSGMASIGARRLEGRRAVCWAVVAGLVMSVVLAGHAVALQLPSDLPHPLVIASHLYALMVAGAILWLGAGVGHSIVRRIGLPTQTSLETWLFAVTIGLGVVSYTLLGLGLAGLLRAPFIAMALILLAIAARRDLRRLVGDVPGALHALQSARSELRRQPHGIGMVVPIVELLLMVLVLQALAPPTGYDGLMYHLMGPKRLLELGRIDVVPDMQQANMPFTIDLLYSLGLLVGSDEMPNVLHLALALLVATSTFSFTRDFLGPRVAFVAVGVFFSATIFTTYAPMPNVDFGLALFDFLAVSAFVHWLRDRRPVWLATSGALVGFALGTKYLGGISALALGLAVLWTVRQDTPGRYLRQIVRVGLTYGVPAALVAAPWYAKNWLWLGSPVWPFLANDPTDLLTPMQAHANFGRGAVDYLLLPLRVYFGETFEYPLARPPLLLLLLPLYAAMPKHRVVTGLLLLAGFHIAIWSQGAQVARYLTSVLPELSVATAYVLVQLARHPRLGAAAPLVASGVFVSVLTLSVTIALISAFGQQPFLQSVGLESREAFLARQLPNHPLVTRINGERESVRGVLLVGDRRAFYLQTPVWVDVSLGAFEALALAPDADAARAYLSKIGVSHVLVSGTGLEWHRQFDADGRLGDDWQRFDRTSSAYLEVETRYYDYTLYRMIPAR